MASAISTTPINNPYILCENMSDLKTRLEEDLRLDKKESYTYFAEAEKTSITVSHYFNQQKAKLQNCYSLAIKDGGCQFHQIQKIRAIFDNNKYFLAKETIDCPLLSEKEATKLVAKANCKLPPKQIIEKLQQFNWLYYVTLYRLRDAQTKEKAIEHYLQEGLRRSFTPCAYGKRVFSTLSDYFLTRRTQYDRQMIFWEDKLGGRKVCESVDIPVPKLYQTARSIDEIDFSKLPSKYVIKWNNQNSNHSVFAIDNGIDVITQKPVSEEQIKKTLAATKKNPAWVKPASFTRFTSFIEPVIIVEELLEHPNKSKQLINTIHKTPFILPWDYKFYFIGGKFKGMLCVDPFDRFDKFHFDENWERKHLFRREPPLGVPESRLPEKPKDFDKMLEYAKTLGRLYKDTFVRIDFYQTNKGPVFGEFTFLPGAGTGIGWRRPVDRLFGRSITRALFREQQNEKTK